MNVTVKLTVEDHDCAIAKDARSIIGRRDKKEGRPRAKYKQIDTYKFRVIVQDAKALRRGTDHDLFFVPKNEVANPKQAKHEAALLASLALTPKIPHEQKLPKPYKTTWLHAVEAMKEGGGKQGPTNE